MNEGDTYSLKYEFLLIIGLAGVDLYNDGNENKLSPLSEHAYVKFYSRVYCIHIKLNILKHQKSINLLTKLRPAW